MPDWRDFGPGNKTCSVRNCDRPSTKRLNVATAGYQRFTPSGEGDWEFRTKELQIVICDQCFGRLTNLGADSDYYALDHGGWDFLRRFIRRAYLQLKHIYKGTKDCPRCKGTGDLKLNQHEREWDECPDCGGSGVEGDDG